MRPAVFRRGAVRRAVDIHTAAAVEGALFNCAVFRRGAAVIALDCEQAFPHEGLDLVDRVIAFAFGVRRLFDGITAAARGERDLQHFIVTAFSQYALDAFRGEYMSNYSRAELTAGTLYFHELT